MKTWRLIPLETHNAFMNMAIDEAILTARIENLVPNTIRFYQWNPSAISIGKNQNINEQVYPDAVANFRVDVVRRTSGGGAVYHDQKGEITYSITAKTRNIGLDFTSVYEKIYSSITDSLRLLGITADFVEGNTKNCPNLTVIGKKISGSAQTVKRETIQQHGTILLDINLKRMFKLLRLKDIDCGLAAKIGKRKITSIKNELKHDISTKTVTNALEQGFRAILKINIKHDKLTFNEKTLAKKLYEKKYLTKDWNKNGHFNSVLNAT
jgi:lipoate-protein ligase A